MVESIISFIMFVMFEYKVEYSIKMCYSACVQT